MELVNGATKDFARVVFFCRNGHSNTHEGLKTVSVFPFKSCEYYCGKCEAKIGVD